MAKSGSTPARRGAVLIIVLAVLLILAMLATVFATFQTIERQTAINVADDVRAKMLAQSGVEFAANELQRMARDGAFMVTDNSGPYSLCTADRTWLYFGAQTDESQPQILSTALEDAKNPSFALEIDNDPTNGPPNPAANPKVYTLVGGQQCGLTASLQGGTYAVNGDVFALKITDESGRININDGVAWGPTHAVSKNLERMVNILGNRLSPPVGGLGTTILTNRPAAGYKDRLELLPILGQTVYNRVKDHVTVASWIDHDVALPVPLSSSVLAQYPAGITYARPPGPAWVVGGGNLYRYGHQKNFKATAVTVPLLWYDSANATPLHNGLYEHDSMNPLWIEVTARAPVNVNTASREVLIALISDLWGIFDSIERRRDRPISYPSSKEYGMMNTVFTYEPGGAYPSYSGVAMGAPLNSTLSVTDGDECGFIYTTMKYVDDQANAITTSTMSAQVIADEIMACRAGATCSHPNGVPGGMAHAPNNYGPTGNLPFANGFRSWAQFNAFVDNLVKVGVIKEQRSTYFFDYFQNGNPKAGGSWIQMRMASQAAADVLKANFNPNLNLNELNPERQLYTMVDKTDLICNSTEFSLMPMNGSFAVEALGRVLKPSDGNDIFAAGIQNEIAAEKKIVAVTHLWDAVRITHQKDFYTGPAPFVYDSDWTTTPGPSTGKKKTDPALPVDFGAVTDSWGTSSFGTAASGALTNFSTISGPEPNNGPIGTGAGWDTNIYSGYVELATYGGSYHGSTAKPSNQYATTIPQAWTGIANTVPAPAAGQASEKMHGHFDVDPALHWHKDNTVFTPPVCGIPCGGWILFAYGQYSYITKAPYGSPPNGTNLFGTIGRATTCGNWADKPDKYAGPYSPCDYAIGQDYLGVAAGPDRYRVCRGFRIPPGGSFAWTPAAYPPGDLRIDGLYAEHGSSVGYFTSDSESMMQSNLSTYITQSTWRFQEGTACFWMKPNWYPECSGKVRIFYSSARYRYHIHTIQQGAFLYVKAGLDQENGEKDCNHSQANYSSMAFDMTPFTLYYLPAQLDDSGGVPTYDAAPSASSPPDYDAGSGKFRPASLGFGMGMGDQNGADWDSQLPIYGWSGYYSGGWKPDYFANLHASCVTGSLNHEGHGNIDNGNPIVGEDGGFNRLRGHEWVHVIVNWQMPAPGATTADSNNNFQIYVNGDLVSLPKVHPTSGSYANCPLHAAEWGAPRSRYTLWMIDPVLIGYNGDTFWGADCVRLGGETDGKPLTVGCDHDGDGKTDPVGANYNFTTSPYPCCSVSSPLPRMFTADSTFDEFYLWTDRSSTVNTGGMTNALPIWDRGRFWRADDSNANDALYTSKAINLVPPTGRRILAPASTVSAPPSPQNSTPSTLSMPAAGANPPIRILGIGWTCYAEAYNPTLPTTTGVMIGYMRDWGTPTNPLTMIPSNAADVNGFKASTVVEMRLSADNGATWLGPYRNDGFSSTNDATGAPVLATTPTQIKFRAKFRVGPGGTGATLLASPILDDVTITYTNGEMPNYLSYLIETIR